MENLDLISLEPLAFLILSLSLGPSAILPHRLREMSVTALSPSKVTVTVAPLLDASPLTGFDNPTLSVF